MFGLRIAQVVGMNEVIPRHSCQRTLIVAKIKFPTEKKKIEAR
jgi:hypothetical protein